MSDVQHGLRHAPRGSDPSSPDAPVIVGVDPRVPYINGFPMAPTAESPNPTPFQFSFVIGQPNECEYSGWSSSTAPVATSIVSYRLHVIEFVGDVDGVAIGDIVCVIPMEYRYQNDRPCRSHDDAGNYVPCRLLSTGEFIYGVP